MGDSFSRENMLVRVYGKMDEANCRIIMEVNLLEIAKDLRLKEKFYFVYLFFFSRLTVLEINPKRKANNCTKMGFC